MPENTFFLTSERKPITIPSTLTPHVVENWNSRNVASTITCMIHRLSTLDKCSTHCFYLILQYENVR